MIQNIIKKINHSSRESHKRESIERNDIGMNIIKKIEEITKILRMKMVELKVVQLPVVGFWMRSGELGC